MYKPSIYDRISARREAQEEAARLAKLAEAAHVPEPVPTPEPVPAVLQDVASGFTFAGFNLQFPVGFRFRDIQTTLEHEGEPVSLSIRRRDVRARQPLEQLFERAIEALREMSPQLRVIRNVIATWPATPPKWWIFTSMPATSPATVAWSARWCPSPAASHCNGWISHA